MAMPTAATQPNSSLTKRYLVNSTNQKTNCIFFLLIGVIVLLALLPHAAFASSTGGSGLPWESPLQKLQESITGPVAFVLSLLGIVVAGSALIFGGEISGFVKTMIFVVLVVAIIIGAQNMMSSLFGRGAEIGTPKQMATITHQVNELVVPATKPAGVH
jgi:type IV secretion system protein TrbC